jgi:hypothetical protein
MISWFRPRAGQPAQPIISKLLEELAAERTARAYVNQRLAELQVEHARHVADLERRLAIAQANFEWLSVSHNKIDAERAALFRDRLHVGIAPMNIETRVVTDDYGTGIPREEVRERQYPENKTPGVGDLAAQGLSFDDVGDREARALGLEDGRVYGDPETLLD